MVATFASSLLTNSSGCGGVNNFSASRPTQANYYFAIGLGLFLANSILAITTIPLGYYFRNEPRMRKIRPFTTVLTLLFSMFIFGTSSFLGPSIENYPCWFITFGWVFGLSGPTCVATLRLLLLTVETRFAKQTLKKRLIEEEDTVTSITIHASSRMKFFFDSYFILTLAFGLNSFRNLDIAQMVLIRNSFRPILCIYISIFAFCFCGMVGIVSPYRECTGCDIFIELPIAIVSFYYFCDYFELIHKKVVTVSVYTVIFLRMLAIAYYSVDEDDHGILQECKLLILACAPFIFVGWLFLLIDPRNLMYQRVINWCWVFFFLAILSAWWILLGYQYYQIFRIKKLGLIQNIGNMRAIIDSNPEIKAQFYEFANKQLVTESIYFLEDTSKYKSLFYDKVSSIYLD